MLQKVLKYLPDESCWVCDSSVYAFVDKLESNEIYDGDIVICSEGHAGIFVVEEDGEAWVNWAD